ncbi:MAG: aldehyde dehydrogenase [Waddliaceae bacterium]|jgi:glyceraldehyde 3-phosphate dehydrogenase|nr:aldehyde dehydrogenase [Waddliaceae bacterium]MBT3579006.1 aldehyde dehydrogenase [Waddliaceae bacterium]MBT4444969.1 aldehyde dehydrogenase [Waddliaceae bacterium]MBT6928590.1 aldehyde dehydrogenase [Waddliaceae bacterium]MBT7264257.1 aldehyde dehydrogenase [Waddliaceae bacterium]
MKKIRVGINGFGRIGRAIFRINELSEDMEVVVINDINPDIKNIAYLLQYDTTYGRLNKNVTCDDNSLIIEDKKIDVYHSKNILDVPWDDYNVDIVIDSSGVSSNLEAIKSDDVTNVKHFIITNAAGGDVKTIIFGVNEDEFDPKEHRILSSSICDTISLSPLLKLIQGSHNIEGGFLTTLHPWLGYQNLLDGPSASWSQPGDIYSHYALGRSSINNLIPKSTSAILAAEHVFPNLSQKIQSFSYRVPTSIVSSAVLILQLDKEICPEDLKGRFDDFEKEQKYHVIKNSEEPLTSMDYAQEDFSVIIDHRWTKVENKNLLKMVYWYDNEWGYSSRVVDLVVLVAEHYNYYADIALDNSKEEKNYAGNTV